MAPKAPVLPSGRPASNGTCSRTTPAKPSGFRQRPGSYILRLCVHLSRARRAVLLLRCCQLQPLRDAQTADRLVQRLEDSFTLKGGLPGSRRLDVAFPARQAPRSLSSYLAQARGSQAEGGEACSASRGGEKERSSVQGPPRKVRYLYWPLTPPAGTPQFHSPFSLRERVSDCCLQGKFQIADLGSRYFNIGHKTSLRVGGRSPRTSGVPTCLAVKVFISF